MIESDYQYQLAVVRAALLRVALAGADADFVRTGVRDTSRVVLMWADLHQLEQEIAVYEHRPHDARADRDDDPRA